MKEFFDSLFSAIFIVEIGAIILALVVDFIPTNAKTLATIVVVFMIVVESCIRVKEKAPKHWSEIKLNKDVLE